MDREISGLLEAMNYFGLPTGRIITQNQSDTFTIGEKTILAHPFYEWETEGK